MRYSFSDSIKDIVSFYRQAKHVPVEHEDFMTKALVYKKGLPYKHVLLGNDFDILGLLPTEARAFYAKAGEIYLIPIDDLTCIRGFLLRNVFGKDFRVVSDPYPVMFGFSAFEGFKYGDLVIVSEGVKDALAVATVYPYSLACLGNHLSVKQSAYLKKITDNIVFMGDNDKSGRNTEKINLKAGCKAVYYLPDSKDPGCLFESENTEVASYIKSVVSINKRKDLV